MRWLRALLKWRRPTAASSIPLLEAKFDREVEAAFGGFSEHREEVANDTRPE